MGYVILSDSREKQGTKIALVDRIRFKNQWWTESIDKAKHFKTKEEAETKCKQIKFNNPQVFGRKAAKKLLSSTSSTQPTSSIERALNRKESEWHDDEWSESC